MSNLINIGGKISIFLFGGSQDRMSCYPFSCVIYVLKKMGKSVKKRRKMADLK